MTYHYQFCSNDDPGLTLTYGTSGQICFLMHLNGVVVVVFLKIDFLNTVKAKVIILT